MLGSLLPVWDQEALPSKVMSGQRHARPRTLNGEHAWPRQGAVKRAVWQEQNGWGEKEQVRCTDT